MAVVGNSGEDITYGGLLSVVCVNLFLPAIVRMNDLASATSVPTAVYCATAHPRSPPHLNHGSNQPNSASRCTSE